MIGHLLAVTEVAKTIGFSARKIYDLIKKKEIRSVKIGGKRLIEEKEIKNLIKKCIVKEKRPIISFSTKIGCFGISINVDWHR
tara:strand:- start:172 stop:420 length:249 start_codon:yes stop_codon:yes gene_type:complete